ncbi:MAG TPA: hypothetical protein VJB14_00545 [Planctomycetota bacterium]|nr:hypothetical protein [Planctomycetota bacterium]
MPMTLAFIAALAVQDGLREFDARVLPEPQPRMTGRDASERIRAANRRESESWSRIESRADWEKYRDARIVALRASLGADEPVPKDLNVRVTKRLDGAGHTIENLVFESRPGLLVTANLYVPAPARAAMPGILIIHSHHNPKTQSELQDMGVLWARLGCLVLVMDQVGHGERRQHPFVDASSFKGAFRPTRQDYWFRYNVGLQLHLAGESLVGWMAWDLMRGVDLLLARPGIEKDRIVLMGSVAGGGDPCGVTAAIDPRIAAAVPFNFGGPQPETKYPLPEDAETTFNYAGGGSWESTRNLRLSARDGFLPWVIVGSLAPRRLVYGHEFSWDRERDPVWKRFGKIYGFYEAGGNLASTTGRGGLSGKPPEATHCNNIGDVHRQGIYAALKKWYDIPAPEKEPQDRRPAADLLCLTPEIKPRLVCELIRDRRAPSGAKAWDLGDINPAGEPKVEKAGPRKAGDTLVERVVLEVEPGIVVPLLFLIPGGVKQENLPVVVAVAQGGKREFLKQRSAEIAALLKGGAAVCLPDLRGTGETRPGDGRGRGSEATSIASSELMLGRTMAGLRVRDLRSVLRYLRGRSDVDRARIGLWGDSFAPVNGPDRLFAMPLDAEGQPHLAEPMGGIVALYTALFEEEVRAVYVRGGLASFRSVLESPFVYIPFDAIVPGASTGADLPKLAEALKPRAVKLEGLVDGLNRRIDAAPIGTAAWLLEPLKGS